MTERSTNLYIHPYCKEKMFPCKDNVPFSYAREVNFFNDLMDHALNGFFFNQ